MALEKKYDATPLQVLTDKETRQRIQRLSRHTGLSQAAVVRELIDFGLARMEELHGLGE